MDDKEAHLPRKSTHTTSQLSNNLKLEHTKMTSNPDVPPFIGYVETTVNALRLIHAARQGLIPRITRRLNDTERRTMIKSGAVFVFCVQESQIKRWTDGLLWSPSRIVGNFLVYREINERTSSRGHKKPYPHDDSPTRSPTGKSSPDQASLVSKTNSGSDQCTFKVGGLMKKTITVVIQESGQEPTHLHLISYYTSEDIRSGKLKTPSTRSDIMSLYMPPHIFRPTTPCVPPKVEIGRDGKSGFVIEAEDLEPVERKVEDGDYSIPASPTWSSQGSPISPVENLFHGSFRYPLGSGHASTGSSVYGQGVSHETWPGPPSSGAYGQIHSSTQPGIYPQLNFPLDRGRVRRDDASEREDSLAQPHLPPTIHRPKLPTTESLLPVQTEAPGYPEQTAIDASSVTARVVYPPYPQHSQSPYPERPKNPFFSRFAYFFQWSHHTRSPPLSPIILAFMEVALKFVLVILPAQIYLHVLLLRLPSLYFPRVARIFEEADMTLPEIKRMALEMASQGLKHEIEIQMAFESSSVPPAYKRLKSTWEFFIDSVMREWKTFNIISVLLLTAILTLLQIQSAAEDPLTRYTALLSLMCALMSLLFGCMYIVCFGTMRKTYKATEWALEAKRTNTLIWWNVSVFLAMPATWLTWSIILYIACIMSFVWRSTATSTTAPGISDTGLLVIRIVITVILGIGTLYGFLIITTFRRYGVAIDKAWKQRIDRWIEEAPGNRGSFAQPALDNPQYPSITYASEDGSTMYGQPTYKSSPYYQPSFGDAHGGYARDTYGPTHASNIYVPPPRPYLRPSHLPHSPSSTDTVFRVNTFFNQSSNSSMTMS